MDLDQKVRTLVERSFPELRHVEISCRLSETAEDFLAGIQWSLTEPLKIILSFSSHDVRQMSDGALTGCIVHELCHAAYDIKLPPSLFGANDQRYAFDSEFRSDHEREIDLAVIKRGYGRELLALERYHNEHYEPYQPSDGLTPEEIEKLMESHTAGS